MGSKGKILFGTFIILIAVLFIDLSFFASQIPDPLGTDEIEVGKADVVVVLTGGQRRLKEALKLFSSGVARTLLVSGIEEGTSLNDILKANQLDTLEPDLIKHIVLDSISRTTRENADTVATWVRDNQIKSLWLVSSNYHLPRASLYLRESLAKHNIEDVRIFEFPVGSPNFESSRWFVSATGWKIFLSEYIKSRLDFVLGYLP